MPDAPVLPPSATSPTKTPTRQSNDRFTRLSDQLGNMGIHREDGSEKAASVPSLYDSGGSSKPSGFGTDTSAYAQNSKAMDDHRTVPSYGSPYAHMLSGTPGSVDRSSTYGSPYAHMFSGTPRSIDRSNTYGASVAMQRTPASVNCLDHSQLPTAMGGGMAYLPANAFALPPGVPLMYGSLYSNPTLNALAQSVATPTQLSGSAMHAMYASPPMYQYPGLDTSGTPVAFQQQGLRMGYSPATPTNTQESSPFSNSGSGNRRQHAAKITPHSRRTNANAGQHNHVDVGRILTGIDVRTTVSDLSNI